MKRKRRPHLDLESLECRKLLSAAVADAAELSEGIIDSYVPNQAALSDDGADHTVGAGQANLVSTTQIALLTAGQPLAVVGGTATTGRQPGGALTGKIVFTVGGHGFTAFSGGWHTQRGESTGTEMNEDLGNQDQMTFFVNYAFNAGATVVPLRPVGYQPNEVVLDNDSAGVTYTGTWTNSASSIFYGSAGDVAYRYASTSATQTATARYTPNITVAGFYPIYTWVKDDTDRVNQTYNIVTSAGTTTVQVDHRRVGKGWVYLGWYYLNAGTNAYVEISNQNATSGIVVADAIRFGNGMGDIDRGLGVSGQTRSDESALYWIEAQKGQGVDDSEFRGAIDSDDDDNVSAPPRWAAWMNRESVGTNTERIFLSFHSNAGSGTSRGALGLYNGNNYITSKTPHQQEWAQLIGSEVRSDMIALSSGLEYPWSTTSTVILDRSDIEFGEINNTVILDEFDATILEVAYHDNVQDAALMRDPKVRDYVARASVQAMIKYFRTYNNQPTLGLPPEAPTNVRSVVQGNGDVTVSWAAPPASAGSGDAATGYVVYRSVDGLQFGNPIVVSGVGTLSTTISAAQLAAGADYFRVSATNAGGESMPTEVIAARSRNAASQILVVQGFDRISRQQNPTQTTPLSYDPPFTPNTGNTFERVRPLFSNSYDYLSRVGGTIAAYGSGIGFDTASNEAVIAGQVNLSNYTAVIWLDGEESTADATFSATEQTLVTNYLNAGGKLFVSGAEIAEDLDNQAHGVSFYNTQLKADFVNNDANTYNVTGSAGSIFAGISLSFDNGSSGTYNVDTPDVLATFGGSVTGMAYSGGVGGTAATVYSGTFKLVNFGFPFETITSAATRNSVMAAVLNFFGITTSGGSVVGRIYQDANSDGAFNGTDVGLAGFTAYLDLNANSAFEANEPNATTDASGNFNITGIAPATYTLRYVIPTGTYVQTLPASGNSYSVVVGGGGSITGKDFALFPTAFTGTDSIDNYYLRLDPTGTNIEISLATSPSSPGNFTIAKNKITTLIFDGSNGDDTITVDYSNGQPTSTPITLMGSGGSDTIRVVGSSLADTFGAGGVSISVSNSNGSGTISVSSVEKFQIDGGLGTDTLNYTSSFSSVVFNGGTGFNADTLNVNTGTYTFNADAQIASINLTINVAAVNAVFNTTQHIAGLNIDGTATVAAGGSKYIVTRALSVNGKLNLNDNKLVYNYTGSSPLSTFFGRIQTGRNGGSWDGSGIYSSSIGSSTRYAIGLAEASQVLAFNGGTNAIWGSETVDNTSLLMRYTYAGDLDLNGKMDGDDYFRIDNGYPANLPGYHWGDIDYSGKIDSDDYFLMDSNYPYGQGMLV